MPNMAHGIDAADIDAQIQLLIRNLVEIKDTLRRIPAAARRRPRHRHQGLERLGVDARHRAVRHLQVLPADARRALPADHARLVPRPLRRRHADQEHQHRRALPHARLSLRGEPRPAPGCPISTNGPSGSWTACRAPRRTASSTSSSTPRIAQQLWDDTLMMSVLPLAKIGLLLGPPAVRRGGAAAVHAARQIPGRSQDRAVVPRLDLRWPPPLRRMRCGRAAIAG